MIRYEHPLNERIRTMMRLEDLFQRARYFSAKAEPNDHHAALNAMFEIAEIASRADPNSEETCVTFTIHSKEMIHRSFFER